ncbi:hypothetical protein [Mangrovimonas sp. TPBH4]|uniref:hypothetical protein n=1 Tax=Mangrovimonas sp. TPBH4 TaxID=1645914 RepID=UPI0006B4634D|nr:hypothetical protein [Mangrovimonas sp. TPBH4]
MIVSKIDYQIDLTELDSVRENLNGYWIMDLGEEHSETERIVCLKFTKNSSRWENVGYKNNFLNHSIEFTSCQSVASLIKVKDSVQIEFVGIGSTDTSKIEYLSKTKLIIDGMPYLKHEGYPELNKIMK